MAFFGLRRRPRLSTYEPTGPTGMGLNNDSVVLLLNEWLEQQCQKEMSLAI